MADKKRILITGISGLLGSNLGFCWKDRYDLLGTYHTHPVHLQGVQTRKVDILSGGEIIDVVRDFRPDVVIHCAALADIDACQENKDLAQQMNVQMTSCVVNALQNIQPKLVYISSDAFYDGSRGMHSEVEKIDPVNYYSLTKYLGELEALKYPGTLIARTAFFGWNIQNKMSFAQQVISKLSNHESIKGFTDVWTSMLYTFDLAALLIKAIEKDLKGVYNFGTSDSMTKYQFAVSLALEFGLNASLIEPVSIDQFNFKAMRSKNLGMNMSKLSLNLDGYGPSLQESIKHFHEDFKHKIPVF